MTNRPNRKRRDGPAASDLTAKRTQLFHAVKASSVPGDTLCKLTKPWEGLPAGTAFQPLSFGMGKTGEQQTITVMSGPRTWERVTGAVYDYDHGD